MTEAQQRRFYFPVWSACAAANDWKLSDNRLLADLDAQRIKADTWDEPAREQMIKVLELAGRLAQAEFRAVIPDDLRHACNFVATGRQASGKMDNKQTNRAVDLFRLLQDPLDLEAIMNWLHPEKRDKGSYLAFLKSLENEAALIAISRNAFGTGDFGSLDIDKLRWIVKQAKGRTQSFHRPASTNYLNSKRQDKREFDSSNAPY